MIKTVSMEIKRDDKDKPSDMCSGSMNRYGYGLCLYLDDDQCKKLGLDKSLPAGTIVKFEGSGIIESSTERVDRDGDPKPDISLSLQITDLGLEPEGTAQHPAELLYTHASS